MVPIHLSCCQHPLPFSLLTDLLPVSLRPPRPRTTGLVNHSSGFSKPSTTVILQNLSFLPPCLLLPKPGESKLFLYLLLRRCSAPWSHYLCSPAPRASRGGYQNHTQIVTQLKQHLVWQQSKRPAQGNFFPVIFPWFPPFTCKIFSKARASCCLQVLSPCYSDIFGWKLQLRYATDSCQLTTPQRKSLLFPQSTSALIVP